MKELKQHLKEDIHVAAVKEVARQHKFFGSVKPHKGQIVWQLNLDNLQIEPATFEQVNFVSVGETKDIGKMKDKGVHKKLVIQAGCIYNVAINKENAKRKFYNRLKREVK